MNPLDKLRQKTEPALRNQQQRRDVSRSTKHYAEFDQIRSGYLRTHTEGDADRFDELLDRGAFALDAFADVVTPDDLLRAGAGCVVFEEHGDCPQDLWRPAWSEQFDRAGEAIGGGDVDTAKAAMLWRIAHLRTFGELPATDVAASVRPPLDSVPFYVFVHAPVDELINVLAACTSTYQVLMDESETWIDASF